MSASAFLYSSTLADSFENKICDLDVADLYQKYPTYRNSIERTCDSLHEGRAHLTSFFGHIPELSSRHLLGQKLEQG